MSKQLPARPNLEFLKNEAKDLHQAYRQDDIQAVQRIKEHHPRQTKANDSAILAAGLTLRDCQLVIAREYGFDSWPKLLIEVPNAAPRRIKLREAIYANKIALVQSILEQHPDLISTAIDVWQRRPLATAANAGHLDMVKCLLVLNPEDTAEAFNRACLQGHIGIAEFILKHDPQIDVGPMLLSPCESLDAKGIEFLLRLGADPNYANPDDGQTPLGMAVSTYILTERRQPCVQLLVEAGASYPDHVGYDILSGNRARLKSRLAKAPSLAKQCFNYRPDGLKQGWGAGAFGAPFNGATLLHLCAHFNFLEEAKMLVEAGANANARADSTYEGCDHTPLFHAVNSNHNYCFPMVEFLLQQGADPFIKATVKLRGDIFTDVTPLDFAREFPKSPRNLVGEDGKLGNIPHPSVIKYLTECMEKV